MKRAELDTQIVHLKACLHYKKNWLLDMELDATYIADGGCRHFRDLLNKHIFTVLFCYLSYPYK